MLWLGTILTFSSFSASFGDSLLISLFLGLLVVRQQPKPSFTLSSLSQDPGPGLGHLLCPSSISSSYTHSSACPSSLSLLP